MAVLRFLLALFLLSCSLVVFGLRVSHDSRAITINGRRRVLLSGSIHYPRSSVAMWPDLIKKAKEGGLDAIETYVFWNAHEPVRRQYDFSGNNDLIRFIKTVESEGLYVVLRIGPYVCAEWNYGGFPVWLHNMPGVKFRTANDVYMNEMQNFTTKIVDMVKQEKLFASQGGPIILSQIENEYGNIMSSYGDAGKVYINWAAKMADSQNIGVPWLMCQQKYAPQPMIETCNGFYCDDYTPTDPTSPKIWTENWTGWFKNWGGKDPHRTTEDLAYSVARFFQTGGTFNNYYMYHGGTNFGRTAGGPYITTSYDYDAPLDEFGNLNQPKWGHLKQLHDVLHSMEKILTYGNITNMDLGNGVSATIYSIEDSSSCFLGNVNTTTDATVSFKENKYTVPAWSVSVLPDCKNEAYNTAKVNTQTTMMVKKKKDSENEPSDLMWLWRSEVNDGPVLNGKGQTSANLLIDQKATNDDSDYLWYMTSVHLEDNDPIWGDHMRIRVNFTGQILHAYVNGEHIGSKFESYDVFNSNFEKNVNLKRGNNQISLLSVTVGLQNYGPQFDLIQNGIPGPVEIVGKKGDDETIIKDLSKHKWSYQTGLAGLTNHFYNDESSNWQSNDLPTNKMLIWYKTTFKAPLGEDPVVVDLKGLGKGYAWVNGNNIGRYWPSFNADLDGCSAEPCDYRGAYDSKKCVSNCGQPTQRWYHIPRSFFTMNGENALVLLEEFGGNPSFVNFQTIVPGSVCGNFEENKFIELSCPGSRISDIKFASFGDVQGTCGSYIFGSCETTNDVRSIISKACVGKESCSLEATKRTFGETNCTSIKNRLVVEALC